MFDFTSILLTGLVLLLSLIYTCFLKYDTVSFIPRGYQSVVSKTRIKDFSGIYTMALPFPKQLDFSTLYSILYRFESDVIVS